MALPLTLTLTFALCVIAIAAAEGAAPVRRPATQSAKNFVLDYDTTVDPALQSKLESIDTTLREKFSMTPEQTAVGVLDLKTLRLAMIHPDRIEYAASIPKV